MNKSQLDVPTMDVLCWKGEMELRETKEMWKTKAHVQRYVLESRPKQAEFIADFYNPKTLVETWD